MGLLLVRMESMVKGRERMVKVRMESMVKVRMESMVKGRERMVKVRMESMVNRPRKGSMVKGRESTVKGMSTARAPRTALKWT